MKKTVVIDGILAQIHNKMVEEVADYAILLLDTDGIVLNWNKGAERIKGYTESEIVGQHFSKFYTEADQEQNLPDTLLSQARILGRTEANGWRVRKDGSVFWGSVSITALHDDDGRVIGFTKVTKDLTEENKRKTEISEGYERMLLFVKHAPSAIAMFDRNMRYIAVSEQWISDYKLHGKEIIGKSHYEVFPEIGANWKRIHQDCLCRLPCYSASY
ncbi:MAG: PAS domain S-box protein [Bacteroidetes bacterium]|nr:PAS domain S-box protein [Bacteroidota bacterium]